jgi:CubicO group peptidase (beta-lactamase class C family)
MMTRVSLLALCCLLGACLLAETPPKDATPLCDIPRLDGITIDGDASDWGDRGFRVGPLMTLEGAIRPADNYDSRFRLGWCNDGVLFVGFVRDSFIEEEEKLSALGGRDAMELFMGTQRNTPGFYQVQIAPGADPKFGGKARWYFYDYRSEAQKGNALAITVAGKRIADGYVLEALLPFANLKATPAPGLELGMQVWMTDSDGRGDWFRTLWYPEGYRGPGYTGNLARIRLADKPSAPVTTVASGQYERFRRVRVGIFGTEEAAGKRVVLKDGKKTLAAGVLAVDGPGRVQARFTLPMPAPGKPYGDLAVLVDGKRATTVKLPQDIEAQKAQAYYYLSPNFTPALFSGTLFPRCDFDNVQLVEDLIGPYTIKTTFYDKNYQPVTRAEKPGRYGAVVEVAPESGARPRTWFMTLYRVPDGVATDDMGRWLNLNPPKELGIDPALLKERDEVTHWILGDMINGYWAHDNGAVNLFATLCEDKAGAPSDDWNVTLGITAHRRYWLGLKRKLYGTDKQFPGPFVAPRPKEGAPAAVVHAGTLQEAGMKADTPANLDKILAEWSANTDEAFIACVVRHGVIVYNKAFGTRREGDKVVPMTVDTPSYMASLTKFMSGTCMMMVVDQGAIGLDESIDKVLVPFRGAKVPTPLTVRRLYTHYNGGWDHSGEYAADFEEALAWYAPHLKIGDTGLYNGQGYNLGSRIIEQVSGETLHDFYVKHLWGPLGCTRTTGHESSYGSMSTALDMARMAQMVLNKGAYGNQRFFSEATWKQMMPTKLTPYFGPKVEQSHGIGCVPWGGPGLSDDCIGHGAASSAECIIDFKNDLIITMTRNAAGSNYAKYNPLFIQTVTDGLVK